jgi:hypothetical protein
MSSSIHPVYPRQHKRTFGSPPVLPPHELGRIAGLLVQEDRPGIRVVVYDHSFEGNRAWFRFAFKWSDPKTGEPHSRAGMQSYRIESGKLVETWFALQPLGSTWTDTPQAHWTSPPAIN